MNFLKKLSKLIILTLATNTFLYFLYQTFAIPRLYWLILIAIVFVIGFRKLLGPGFSPTLSEGFPTVDSIRMDHKNTNYQQIDGPSSIFGFFMMLCAFFSLYFCLAVT